MGNIIIDVPEIKVSEEVYSKAQNFISEKAKLVESTVGVLFRSIPKPLFSNGSVPPSAYSSSKNAINIGIDWWMREDPEKMDSPVIYHEIGHALQLQRTVPFYCYLPLVGEMFRRRISFDMVVASQEFAEWVAYQVDPERSYGSQLWTAIEEKFGKDQMLKIAFGGTASSTIVEKVAMDIIRSSEVISLQERDQSLE